jgi:hypothetical protein
MGATTTGTGDAIEILRRMDREFVARAKAGDARSLVEGFYADDACGSSVPRRARGGLSIGSERLAGQLRQREHEAVGRTAAV